MFIIKGAITIVTELELAIEASQYSKIVFIGELKQLPPNFIEFSVLLPPMEALECEINGDMQSYAAIYSQYLDMTPYCQEALKTILTSVACGVNIIFYIEEGNNLTHLEFLKNYFASRYGMILGGKNNIFSYDIRYNLMNAITIYTFIDNIVSLDDILLMTNTAGDILSSPLGRVLFEKVATENNLTMNEAELLQWLEQYRKRLILLVSNQNNGTTVPFIEWRK